jgi:hypothetical protein
MWWMLSLSLLALALAEYPYQAKLLVMDLLNELYTREEKQEKKKAPF